MRILLVFLLLVARISVAQELYVSSEPASNMPAKSIGIRLNNYVMPSFVNRSMYRFNPELMWGISKKIMLHFNIYASNIHQNNFRAEGAGLYLKYRFLSKDFDKKHFRMAAYFKGSIVKNPIHYDEINLSGDNTGINGGIVATQLIRKLAVSFTGGYIHSFDNPGENLTNHHSHDKVTRSLNGSLSGGYLLFPVKYKNYNQPNLNVYAEFLAKTNPGSNAYFIDFAPAIQLIFKSKMRLDLAYRRQIAGDMLRIKKEIVLKFEYNFFNAYKGKNKK
jgi:hypothetical protein